MIKKIITISVLMLIINISVYGMLNSNLTVTMGTQKMIFDKPLYIIDDTAYDSLRELCDKLGIPIQWINESRQINIDTNNKIVPHNKNSSSDLRFCKVKMKK